MLVTSTNQCPLDIGLGVEHSINTLYTPTSCEDCGYSSSYYALEQEDVILFQNFITKTVCHIL